MQEKKLEMYGGLFGGLIPLIVLVGGLVWLSVAERGRAPAFWGLRVDRAVRWDLLRIKTKRNTAKRLCGASATARASSSLRRGCWPGVRQAHGRGGLVQGLLWMGMTTGAQGGVFVVLVFLAAMLFALGTGTSTGTCIALSPVLYPAGYFLGADPAMLGLAILSGAAFGDNLAPISDTTIVSAYTQGAEMRDVVRSRFPLAISAASISAVVFLVFGGGGEVRPLPEMQASLNPSGLFMLLALAIVVVSALKGRHIIESLIYGNVAAAFVGMLIGTIRPADIFSVPAAKGGSTGLIQAGIDNVVGAIIFAILILAVTQILVECGIMRRILDFAQSTLVATVRQAELFIVGVTILASIPISRQCPGGTAGGPEHRAASGRAFRPRGGAAREPHGLRGVHDFLCPAVAYRGGGVVRGALQRGGNLCHPRPAHQRGPVQSLFMGTARGAAVLRLHRLEPQVRQG